MLLSCRGLGLSFGDDLIFRDVSFDLEEGEKLALVGVNGAGKTSLLRIICGENEYHDGTVELKSGASVAYLRQNAVLDSDLTVHEEMLSVFSDLIAREARIRELEDRMAKGRLDAADAYEREFAAFKRDGGLEFRARTVSTLAGMGFGGELLDVRVNSLSGGQKTVLGLVKVLLRAPDLLILDEPTNHLDSDALRWLEGHLKKLKSAFIVVSHDRYFLDRTTQATLELENGRATLYGCPYSEYRRRKEKDRLDAEKRYRDQQKEIKRIKEYIQQQRQWNRERNIIAAESRQKLLDKMEKFEKPDALPKGISFSFESSVSSGEEVLRVSGLSKRFGDRVLFEDLDFLVRRGDRLFILGPNGCGKSTLLKILCSRIPQTSGIFEYGYNVKAGYYDQENQDLNPASTVFDELWAYSDSMERTRRLLSLFGFCGDDVFKSVSDLSGGEKARLTLAKLMQKKMNLLILDEPTNHLDILSREALENAVKDFDGTVIAVSHDRYFINALATRILALGSGKPELFNGGYSDYLEFVNRREAQDRVREKDDAPMSAAKAEYLLNKQQRSAERTRQKELERTEARIAEAEGEIASIDGLMSGEAASDYKRLSELSEKRAALDGELALLYEKWESLQS